jgi:acetyltransferase-like isoleucine patch superfamily enzyme
MKLFGSGFLGKYIKEIGALSYFLINPKIANGIPSIFTIMYSGRVRKSFARCGDNNYISCPIYLIGDKNISIGEHFVAFARLRIEAHVRYKGQNFSPKIVIGNNVSVNYDCHIGCIEKIIIGNNVLIASRVFITDHFHGDTTSGTMKLPPAKRDLVSKGPVLIEDNRWIGKGVIMPNVTIGENSIIGANSVVNKSVAKNTVVAGVPAVFIKEI